MDVTRIPPPEPPSATYEITGLTFDEAVFLRDLMGKFPLDYRKNPPKGFPVDLYQKLYQHTKMVDSENDFTLIGGILRVNGNN